MFDHVQLDNQMQQHGQARGDYENDLPKENEEAARRSLRHGRDHVRHGQDHVRHNNNMSGRKSTDKKCLKT